MFLNFFRSTLPTKIFLKFSGFHIIECARGSYRHRMGNVQIGSREVVIQCSE